LPNFYKTTLETPFIEIVLRIIGILGQ
jgi:hypothetical protein